MPSHFVSNVIYFFMLAHLLYPRFLFRLDNTARQTSGTSLCDRATLGLNSADLWLQNNSDNSYYPFDFRGCPTVCANELDSHVFFYLVWNAT